MAWKSSRDWAPPLPTCDWQRKLRGAYINVRNSWVQFDLSLVEEVKSGVRRSIAVRDTKRVEKDASTMPWQARNIGFLPPLTTHVAEADAAALPFGHSTQAPSSSLATAVATELLLISGSLFEFAECNSLQDIDHTQFWGARSNCTMVQGWTCVFALVWFACLKWIHPSAFRARTARTGWTCSFWTCQEKQPMQRVLRSWESTAHS